MPSKAKPKATKRPSRVGRGKPAATKGKRPIRSPWKAVARYSPSDGYVERGRPYRHALVRVGRCGRGGASRTKGILPVLGSLLFLAMLLPPAASAWEVDDTSTVTRVIDGDTFDANPIWRVRLADIDAPETGQPGYQEAKDLLTSLVGGSLVYLDIDDVYGTDQYGRYIAVVYVRHNATHLLNVNWALLDAGVAVISDYTNEFHPWIWTEFVAYPPPPAPPSVSASASVVQGTMPLTVSLTAMASGGAPPYTFSWTFGDGGTSAIQSPAHTYAFAGIFPATVTVTDNASRTDTDTVWISVASPPSPPPPSTSPGADPVALAVMIAFGLVTAVSVVFSLLQRRKRVR